MLTHAVRTARRPTPRPLRPRPHVTGSVSHLLDLQTSAGNRAVTRMVAQRRGTQGLLDKPIEVKAPRAQVIDDELVPVGEVPGRFAGFATKAEAAAIAQRSPEVSVIVNDPDRFHVLRTTATTLGGKATAPTLPKGWTVVEMVEPTNVSAPGAFEQDASSAASSADKPTAYRKLLVRGSHLELGDTAWSPSDGKWAEGKVNVALWLPSRGRHEPAKVDPTGSAAIPAPSILMGKSPFGEGAVSMRSTLLHESRHAYHMAQTIELVRMWRTGRKQDTLESWQKWLKAKKASVPAEVYQTTWAATDLIYGTATTETYSYMHGFMYRFRRDDDAARDPTTMDAATIRALYLRMLSLNSMGEFYEHAAQDARESTLDRIVRWAATLSAHHRQHLRDFMTWNAKGAGAAPRVFYREFAKRL